MRENTYIARVKDPDGIRRRFVLFPEVPVQKFTRGRFEVTITHLRQRKGLFIDKIDWDRRK